MPDLSEQIRSAQRELMAFKRGMFGGARSYFESQASTHTFTGTTSTDLTITLSFERSDFPMLFSIVTVNSSQLGDFVVQRTGLYTWRVFIGNTTSRSYSIKCTCMAEQIPSWSIGP